MATEDLVYMLEGMGVSTGINLEACAGGKCFCLKSGSAEASVQGVAKHPGIDRGKGEKKNERG